ncbi:hypothetical protein FNV43_RR23371 [Rhamnella rubrinervis]|uniref:SMP domain-containing protein n=1 Tax=Rhamnella rubrinervis TaxID=2594499 RepID=A0A8K0DYD9_9ROSA|nr:hypothetical protein FNV43_RR23371 [Rhamnella rubrinervis]
MRVQQALWKRNINITPCHVASSSSMRTHRKLRKLPHIFAKVLQLPFHSNADVSVRETSHNFLFTIKTDSGYRAHTFEICPGVVKIEVRRTDHQHGCDVSVDDDDDDQLNLDLWRFRLPASARPEMASATSNGQELVVTVPKDLNSEDKIHVKDDKEDGEVNLTSYTNPSVGQVGAQKAMKVELATTCKTASKRSHMRPPRVNQVTDVPRNEGVTVVEVDVVGNRVIREAVGGQVVAEYVEPQLTALSIGDKPVEQSDASAIQAAEVRATGTNEVQPGGVAATAQAAATYNARTMFEGGKTKVSDVLLLRNNPNMSTTPGGVADSVAAAATLNQT